MLCKTCFGPTVKLGQEAYAGKNYKDAIYHYTLALDYCIRSCSHRQAIEVVGYIYPYVHELSHLETTPIRSDKFCGPDNVVGETYAEDTQTKVERTSIDVDILLSRYTAIDTKAQHVTQFAEASDSEDNIPYSICASDELHFSHALPLDQSYITNLPLTTANLLIRPDTEKNFTTASHVTNSTAVTYAANEYANAEAESGMQGKHLPSNVNTLSKEVCDRCGELNPAHVTQTLTDSNPQSEIRPYDRSAQQSDLQETNGPQPHTSVDTCTDEGLHYIQQYTDLLLLISADLCNAHYALCEYHAGLTVAERCDKIINDYEETRCKVVEGPDDNFHATKLQQHTSRVNDTFTGNVSDTHGIQIRRARLHLVESKCLYELFRLTESLQQANLSVSLLESGPSPMDSQHQPGPEKHIRAQSKLTLPPSVTLATTRLLKEAQSQQQLVLTTINERTDGTFDVEALLASDSHTTHHRHRAYDGPTRVVDIAGKGKGVVATRDIPRGELVMAAYPFASVVVGQEKDGVETLGTLLYERAQCDGEFARVLSRLFSGCNDNANERSGGAETGGSEDDRESGCTTSGHSVNKELLENRNGTNKGPEENAITWNSRDGDDMDSNTSRTHPPLPPRWEVLPLTACRNVVRMNAFACERHSHKTDLHEFLKASTPTAVDFCCLYDRISYLNHACASNTTRMIVKGLHLVRARCDIRRGEEITTAYADSDYTASRWEFECVCEYCALVPHLPGEVVQAAAACEELESRVNAHLERGQDASGVEIGLLQDAIACIRKHLVQFFDRECSPSVQAKIVQRYLMRPSYVLYGIMKRRLDAQNASDRDSHPHDTPTDPRTALDILITGLSVLQDSFDTWDSSVFMLLVGESMRLLPLEGAGALPMIEHYLEMAVQAELDVIGDHPEWAYEHVKRQAEQTLGIPAAVIDRILLTD